MNENNAQINLELFSEDNVAETTPKIQSISKKKKYYEMVHETVKHYGYDHASLMDLLTLVAGPKVPETTIMELSMMDEKELMSISPKDIPGVGPTIAGRIRACIELGKRVVKNHSYDNFVMIKSPEDAANKLSWLSVENQEKFVVLFLNTKNRVIAERTIFTGSLNASIVHPREVFNQALKLSAATIIVSHNHPSGDPKPSREDIDVTKRLVEVGKIVGIEVLDHIIIGSSGKHCSLKEKGYV